MGIGGAGSYKGLYILVQCGLPEVSFHKGKHMVSAMMTGQFISMVPVQHLDLIADGMNLLPVRPVPGLGCDFWASWMSPSMDQVREPITTNGGRMLSSISDPSIVHN